MHEQITFLQQHVAGEYPDLAAQIRPPVDAALGVFQVTGDQLHTRLCFLAFAPPAEEQPNTMLYEAPPELLIPIYDAGWVIAGNSPQAIHVAGAEEPETKLFVLPGKPDASLYDLSRGQYSGNDGPVVHIPGKRSLWDRLLHRESINRIPVRASTRPEMLPLLRNPNRAEEIVFALGKLSANSQAVVSNLPADLMDLQQEQGIVHTIPPKLILVREESPNRFNTNKILFRPAET